MNESVSEQEQRVIDEFLLEHFPEEHSKNKVYALEGKNRKKVKDKIIFLVGNYRIFIFGRAKHAKDKPFHVHLYDICEIEVVSEDTFGLKNIDPKTKTAVPFLFVSGSNIHGMITNILNAYQRISHEFPEEKRLKVVPERHYPLESNTNISIANGFLDVYRAQCSYYKTPVCEEFLNHVENLVSSQHSVDFDLTECPGIEPKSDISLNFQPVAAALRYNTYFRSVVLSHVSRKEVVSLLADTLSHNTAITKLCVDGSESDEKGFVELGAALKGHHSVQVLALKKESNFGNKAMISLGEALQMWAHALTVIDLSGCGIHAKGIAALMCAFEKNYGLSLGIETLDLSGNNFDKEGTLAFESWMSNVKAYAHLKTLRLGSSNVAIASLLSLKLMAHLTELDVSGNKIDPGVGCLIIADTCEHNHTLRKLNISNCSLTKDSAQPIVEAYFGNPKLENIELNISHNDGLGARGVTWLAGLVAKTTNLVALDVSHIKMKEKSFIEIVEACTNCKKLEKFVANHVFNKNGDKNKDKTTLQIVVSLSILVTQNTRVKTLHLAGGYGRPIILPFLQALEKNSTVTTVDVSDNRLGDKGAESISSLLRRNTTITDLSYINNKITLNGFRAIQMALARNQHVVNMMYPAVDVEKALSSLDHIPKKIQLSHVVANIYQMLEANAAQSGRVRSSSQAAFPPTPLSVTPLAEVPEFLKNKVSDLTFEDVPDFVSTVSHDGNTLVTSNSNIRKSEKDKEHSSSSSNSHSDEENHKNNKSKTTTRSQSSRSLGHADDDDDPPPRATPAPLSPPSLAPIPPVGSGPGGRSLSVSLPPSAPKATLNQRPVSVHPSSMTSITPTPSAPPSSPPPPASSSPPPPPSPPASSGGPPPPPPPAPGPPPPPASVPPSSSSRNAMLSGIRGFDAKKLKKAETVDKSAPVLTTNNSGGGAGGGASANKASAGGGGNLMAEALAKRRKALE